MRMKQPDEKVSKQKGYNAKGRRLKSIAKSLSKMTYFKVDIAHKTIRKTDVD